MLLPLLSAFPQILFLLESIHSVLVHNIGICCHCLFLVCIFDFSFIAVLLLTHQLVCRLSEFQLVAGNTTWIYSMNERMNEWRRQGNFDNFAKKQGKKSVFPTEGKLGLLYPLLHSLSLFPWIFIQIRKLNKQFISQRYEFGMNAFHSILLPRFSCVHSFIGANDGSTIMEGRREGMNPFIHLMTSMTSGRTIQQKFQSILSIPSSQIVLLLESPSLLLVLSNEIAAAGAITIVGAINVQHRFVVHFILCHSSRE